MFEKVVARRVGVCNIVLGIVSITVGLAVGIGCIVAGGQLLSKF